MFTRLVYTIVLDGYDSIKPIKNNIDADYFCITNDTNLKEGQIFRGWTIKKLEIIENPSYVNRKFKMAPWLLGNYDESVYMDANIFPKKMEMLFDNTNCDIQLFKHRNRKTVKEEFEQLLRREDMGDRTFGIKNWPRELLNKCLDLKQLYWGGFIYRVHNEKVKIAMEEWWGMYDMGITRDQISLPYILNKHNLEVGIKQNLKSNIYVFPHRKNGSLYSILLDLCSNNPLFISFFIHVLLPIRRIMK